MRVLSPFDLRRVVNDDGSVILWTGCRVPGTLVIMLSHNDGSTEMVATTLSLWKTVYSKNIVVRLFESDVDAPGVVDVLSDVSGIVGTERVGAILGVNMGGDCHPGPCKIRRTPSGCVLSYDIETSMEGVAAGKFGLLDARILSIGAKCTCGYEYYKSSIERYVKSSDMVSSFIQALSTHRPLWAIGWNVYCFDNEVMRYHANSIDEKYFRVTRVSIFGEPKYGSIIDIDGCYNIDVEIFIYRYGYRFTNFKLETVAISLGVEGKLTMPHMSHEIDPQTLREYNMNDCRVVLDIWRKEAVGDRINVLSIVCCSHIYDCARYVTGTFMTCAYSSLVISKGMVIEWTPCTKEQDYPGGLVFKPRRGRYNKLSLCDYKSMYPSIIMSCGICVHNAIIVNRDSKLTSTVHVDKHKTIVASTYGTVVFDSQKESLLGVLMNMLISERDKYRRSHPIFAQTLKVAANSAYGSLGFSSSALYSPMCASAITSIGRHCLQLAKRHFESQSLNVIYGDTDSCMVTHTHDDGLLDTNVDKALRTLHDELNSTTLHRMRMEIEGTFSGGLLLGKKMYVLLRHDGTRKNVGISLIRSDVPPLCKVVADKTLQLVFHSDAKSSQEELAKYMERVILLVVSRNLTLEEVSLHVKRNGEKGYEYQHVTGETRFIPEVRARPDDIVSYDVDHLIKLVRSHVERYSIVGGLGTMSDIMNQVTL